MNKPLKDWTLGEIQERCREAKDCIECIFQNQDGCIFLLDNSPEEWDLSDPSRFTAEEVETAKALRKAFPLYDNIYRSTSCTVIMGMGQPVVVISSDTFPSIDVDETVSLKEIAGCEDDQQGGGL
jgi:hypothetical protein